MNFYNYIITSSTREDKIVREEEKQREIDVHNGSSSKCKYSVLTFKDYVNIATVKCGNI